MTCPVISFSEVAPGTFTAISLFPRNHVALDCPIWTTLFTRQHDNSSKRSNWKNGYSISSG